MLSTQKLRSLNGKKCFWKGTAIAEKGITTQEKEEKRNEGGERGIVAKVIEAVNGLKSPLISQSGHLCQKWWVCLAPLCKARRYIKRTILHGQLII